MFLRALWYFTLLVFSILYLYASGGFFSFIFSALLMLGAIGALAYKPISK